jgi:hypothetical protein
MTSSGAGCGWWLQGPVDSFVSPCFLFPLFSLPSPFSMLCRNLDNNHLTGTIPSQLAELAALTVL